MTPTPVPPARESVCRHDVRGHLRQACCCCGACDHVDFRVTDGIWTRVVPAELSGAHVCLRCFDALAAEAGVDYAADVERLSFAGERASIIFTPASAVDCQEQLRLRSNA